MVSGVACEILWQNEQILNVRKERYLVQISENDAILEWHQDRSLVTVFHVHACETSAITEDWVQQKLAHYSSTDDVFQPAFLQGVIFCGAAEDELQITETARSLLAEQGMEWHRCLSQTAMSSHIYAGPYALLNGRLREVWRLYKDGNGAFFSTVKARGDGFVAQNLYTEGEECCLNVAVPSRLKVHRTPELPMAGIRVAVKDNLDVKGVKTSLSSRPYFETYGPRSKTAPCIQKLVNAGAIIVGKTKMTSFATWEEPTESIDYPAPWNPRADGYLSAGGSSNGSGAAIAAYDWLDIAIGSDTTGSVMRPALWNGCFSVRPSFGALAMDEGFFSCIKYLDTASFLGRDLEKCREFACNWYGDKLNTDRLKQISSIIWPTDYWKSIDFKQCDLAQSFMQGLEIELGLKHHNVSIAQEWDRNPPKEAGKSPLLGYILDATKWMWYDDYHAFDDFREKYWQMNSKAAYVSPPTRDAWEDSKTITKAQREEAVERIRVFREWFRQNIIESDKGHTILILPVENVYARYRDEHPRFQRPPVGMHNLLLAPVLEAPEVVVPIGQIPYASKVTQREEQLPFVVGVMGLPGSDLMLMDVINASLKRAGRPTSVQTGSLMFPPPSNQLSKL